MHGFDRNGRRHAALSAAFFSAVLWTGSAAAQQAIGGAKVIENDVRGETLRGTAPIHRGDQVFQDEWVRTAAQSLAQLALRDETNVSLGPSSQLRLDRFVFDGSGSTAQKVLLAATKGTFRFFSGDSEHQAYQVTTPQASIGVRGTIYDVEIVPGRTRVVLQQGAVHVCVRNTRECTDLTEPGSSVVVTATGISGPLPPAQKTWDFGALCGQLLALLCERTTIAGLDLSLAKTRTQLAALPRRPLPKRAAPTKTAKRPLRRRNAAAPADDDGSYGSAVPAVVTGPPVVPIFPFLGGRLGGFRGGPGGRDRGDSDPPLQQR